MAKRSVDERDSERIETKKSKVEVSETVRLVLMKNVNLNILGPVTGKRYSFSGAGAQVDVDKSDADLMINKISTSRCCDGSGVGKPTPYFEIVR